MAALQVTLLSLLSETNVRPCKSLPEPLPSSCQRSLAPGQAALAIVRVSPTLRWLCPTSRTRQHTAALASSCQSKIRSPCPVCHRPCSLPVLRAPPRARFQVGAFGWGRKWTENAKALRAGLATSAAESTGPRLPTNARSASSLRIWPASLRVCNLRPSASAFLRMGSQRRADSQHGSKLVRWILRKLQSQRVKRNLPRLASSAAQALSASAASWLYDHSKCPMGAGS